MLHHLDARGFRVLFERWDERFGKGIDDVIAAGFAAEIHALSATTGRRNSKPSRHCSAEA